MILQANEQECQALLELLNRALMHSGLQVVDAVVIWRQILASASSASGATNGKATAAQPAQFQANARP